MSIETLDADEALAFTKLSAMLRVLLEEVGLDDNEITMEATFHEDLEMESVDLVALSGQLREEYGDRVNFATFIAERDLEEIMSLTVGDLVRYIVKSLKETA